MDQHLEKVVKLLNKECISNNNKIPWTVDNLSRNYCCLTTSLTEIHFPICANCSRNVFLAEVIICAKEQYADINKKLETINQDLSRRLEIVEDCGLGGHNYEPTGPDRMFTVYTCKRCKNTIIFEFYRI